MQHRISGNYMLPLALWNQQPPSHDVTCILLTPDGQCLITGDSQGKLILWQCGLWNDNAFQIYSKWMMLVHQNALIGLALACGGSDGLRPYVISVADDGNMALWDVDEGRCVEYNRQTNYLHTFVKSYPVPGQIHNRLYCCGRYMGITVYDAVQLQLLFTLPLLNEHCDWFTTFSVSSQSCHSDIEILAVSLSGSLTRWSLPASQVQEDGIVEDTRMLNLPDTISISSHPHILSLFLIACRYSWKIYDLQTWSALLSHKCQPLDALLGGEFISSNRIIIYSLNGGASIFTITESYSGELLSSVHQPPLQLCASLSRSFEMPSAWQSSKLNLKLRGKCFVFFTPSKQRGGPSETSSISRLVSCNSRGDIVVFLHDLQSQQSEHVTVHQPTHVLSLHDYWKTQSSVSNLLSPFKSEGETTILTDDIISSMCNIQCTGKLALGLDSGDILIASTVEILLRLYFGKVKDAVGYSRLQGHIGAVTCLLHPNSCNVSAHSMFDSQQEDSTYCDPTSYHGEQQQHQHQQPFFHSQTISGEMKPLYDPDLLLSGSNDFSVRLWHIGQNTQIASFPCHAGPVTGLYTVPMGPNARCRAVGCVVSVAKDHSLGLISLREKRVILHSAHQESPIVALGWRAVDDFLLISCLDGTVYVWEIGTGYLDRKETGLEGQDIFENSSTFTRVRNSRGQPLFSRLKGIDASHTESRFRSLLLPSLHLLTVSSTTMSSHSSSSVDDDDTLSNYESSSLPSSSSSFHYVLMFDVESIIVNLLRADWSHQHGLSKHRGSITHASSSQLNTLLTSTLTSKRVASSGNLARLNSKREVAGTTIGSYFVHSDYLDSGSESCVDEEDSLENDHQLIYLLCSLLHPWNLHAGADQLLSQTLNLLCPDYLHNPSAGRFHWGLVSKWNALAILMPGWEKAVNIKYVETDELNTMEQDWYVSHTFTTLRWMSFISIVHGLLELSEESLVELDTKCLSRLINHANDELPSPTSAKPLIIRRLLSSSDNDSEDVIQRKGKHPRGGVSNIVKKKSWAMVLRLAFKHLPKLMQIRNLKWPLLQLLALNWQNRCLQIRKSCHKLLDALLSHMDENERTRLAQRWSGRYLPIFSYNIGTYQNKNIDMLATHHDANEQLNFCLQAIPEDLGFGTLFGDFDWWLTCLPDKLPERELKTCYGIAVILLGVMACSYVKNMPDCSHEEVDDDFVVIDYNSLYANSPTSLKESVMKSFAKITGKEAGNHQQTQQVMVDSHCLAMDAFSEDDFMVQCICSTLMGLLEKMICSDESSNSPPTTIENTTDFSAIYSCLPMQRAAMHLLARGFKMWEHHVDFAHLLMTLLHYAKDASFFRVNLEPGMTISDQADSALTAHQSLMRIAHQRPRLFVLALSQEAAACNPIIGLSQAAVSDSIAFANSLGGSAAMLVAGTVYPPNMAIHNQGTSNPSQASLNTNNLGEIGSSQESLPIHAARCEILRCVESLFQTHSQQVSDVLAEAVELLIFCVDKSRLKSDDIMEIWPFLKGFPTVAASIRSRKVVIGSKNGTLAFCDSKHGKYHTITAHKYEISAVEISPEGKFAASFSFEEQQLKIWLISSSSIFGVGGHHVKLHSTHGVVINQNEEKTTKRMEMDSHDGALQQMSSPRWRLNWNDAKVIKICSFNQIMAQVKLP